MFWSYVREVLSRHELQRFYGLRHIASDVGRGRAWLRCALNEHSLERYLHALLADRGRLRYLTGWASGGCGTAGSAWCNMESEGLGLPAVPAEWTKQVPLLQPFVLLCCVHSWVRGRRDERKANPGTCLEPAPMSTYHYSHPACRGSCCPRTVCSVPHGIFHLKFLHLFNFTLMGENK